MSSSDASQILTAEKQQQNKENGPNDCDLEARIKLENTPTREVERSILSDTKFVGTRRKKRGVEKSTSNSQLSSDEKQENHVTDHGIIQIDDSINDRSSMISHLNGTPEKHSKDKVPAELNLGN